MADLMELNIVANVSSVKQAVSTVSRLEKQLFVELWASPIEEVNLGDFLDSLEP